MVDLVIFCRDRAAQLELLLRSIYCYADDIFNINVVWTYSEPSFGAGFKILLDEFPEINFIHKTNPKDETKLLFEKFKAEWLCLSTDDMVFYRPIPLPNKDLASILPKYNDEVFSFRYGYNTIDQDIHRGTKQPPLNLHSVKDGILRWNPHMYSPTDNYGYALAVDLHVFRSSFILPLLKKAKFYRPNELEGYLQNFRGEISYMSSFEQSVAVNIPCNNLSTLTSVNSNIYSLEYLNQQFLAGKRLDLDFISHQRITGAHANIPLKLC